MDDVNDSTDGPVDPSETVALVEVYLESLKARMAPEEYEALTSALHQFWHAMEDGRQATFDMSETGFSEGVRKELMLVMAIIGTGRTDHRVVDLPGPDGSSGWVVVSEAIADDPVKLAEIRDRLAVQWREQQETDEALEGIERASREVPEPGGPGAAGEIPS